MTANRPQPRPGVLDIAPYVPGKSSAPGVAKAFKLSSNETPLGASASTIAAYRAVGEHLEDYPDGSAGALREAIGEVYGLDPARIVCGAGSDDLLNLLARAYLRDGDEAIHTTHGFLVYPIATLGTGAKPIVAPEKDYTADVDAILARVTDKTKIVFLANPNNPTGTYLPFDEVKRLHRSLPGNVLLILDAAYAEYVRRNDYESGIELVATSDNVVMTRTFSKIYGLAAVRLGWMYGPAHVVDAVNRVRGPFNVNAPAIAAGVAAIRDAAHVERAREHNARWLAWLTEEIGKLGLEGDAECRQFRAHPFSRDEGQNGQGRRCLPHPARVDPASACRLQAAQCLAHDHRHRGGQPPDGRSAGGVSGEGGVSKPAALYNRLALIGVGLIGSSIARAAREQGAAPRSSPLRVPPPRASASPSSASPTRWWRPTPRRSQAPISSSSAFRWAPAATSPRKSARIWRPARPSPTSARSRARSSATWRRICRKTCISCRRIRLPAPNIPAPMPALPNCSSTAGAS